MQKKTFNLGYIFLKYRQLVLRKGYVPEEAAKVSFTEFKHDFFP